MPEFTRSSEGSTNMVTPSRGVKRRYESTPEAPCWPPNRRVLGEPNVLTLPATVSASTERSGTCPSACQASGSPRSRTCLQGQTT